MALTFWLLATKQDHATFGSIHPSPCWPTFLWEFSLIICSYFSSGRGYKCHEILKPVYGITDRFHQLIYLDLNLFLQFLLRDCVGYFSKITEPCLFSVNCSSSSRSCHNTAVHVNPYTRWSVTIALNTSVRTTIPDTRPYKKIYSNEILQVTVMLQSARFASPNQLLVFVQF